MELEGLGILLGVKSPWVLKDIVVQNKNQVIDVFIDFEKGTEFNCPCCGELKPVYDSYTKRVRYLDLFDFRCYLNIKTPRINCSKDGIKTTHSDPWSRKGSHYSFKFESLIMRLCKEMSVSAVSRELG
jgi:transposase